MARRFRLWFSSINLKKICVRFRATGPRLNQWRKSLNVCKSVCLCVCTSVSLYVTMSVCLSVCHASSSPIFYVLICSDHHQIWQVCSLVHNLEDIFVIFRYVDFFRFSDFIDFLNFDKFWVHRPHFIIPIFYALKCSDQQQSWQVCSSVHNPDIIFFYFLKNDFFRNYWLFGLTLNLGVG